MSALIPYSEPPIPRVALEIERLRQRLEAAEAELKARERAPMSASTGAPLGRQLAVISTMAAVALVVIAGSLVWSMTGFRPSRQPVTLVKAPPSVVQAPQLSEPSLPASVQSAQSLVPAAPRVAQAPQVSQKSAPARAQSAQLSRQAPPARRPSVQASRQTPSARSQSVQSARQKPAIPRQIPPAQMQVAQSSFRGGALSPYYRPSIILPPPVRPGYMW